MALRGGRAGGGRRHGREAEATDGQRGCPVERYPDERPQILSKVKVAMIEAKKIPGKKGFWSPEEQKREIGRIHWPGNFTGIKCDS